MRMWKMAGTLALLCTTLIGSPVRAQPRQLLPRLSRKDVKHRLSVERVSRRAVQREIGVDLIPPAPQLEKFAQGPLLASAEVAPPSGEATPPRAAPAPVQQKTIRESAEPDPEPVTGKEDGQVVGPQRGDPSNPTAPEPDAADVEGTGGGGISAPESSAEAKPHEAPFGAAEPKGGPAAADAETIHIVVLDGSGFTQMRDIQSPISGERHQLVRDDQGRLIEIVRDREGNMLSARDVGPEELPQ
jgi:YD repeat-containing protein